MKFGLIHYNQSDLETFQAFLEFAAEAGFDAVELFLKDYWWKVTQVRSVTRKRSDDRSIIRA